MSYGDEGTGDRDEHEQTHLDFHLDRCRVASRGAFRFVTGSQNKGDYRVKTPYGTLGVRG